MSRNYYIYLRDILKATRRVQVYVVGLDFEGFQANPQVIDAVLFNLLTIGEAVKNIPESVKGRYPQVAWREPGRFRDLVANYYFRLDNSIVWGIVQTDLPLPAAQVGEIVKLEGEEST